LRLAPDKFHRASLRCPIGGSAVIVFLEPALKIVGDADVIGAVGAAKHIAEVKHHSFAP
jgi:hypothetical protein